MSNQLTFVSFTNVTNYSVRAMVSFGKAQWEIQIANDEAASTPYTYQPSVQIRARETVVDALEMIGQALDEHNLDAMMLAERAGFAAKEQKIREEKERQAKELELSKIAALEKRLALLFPEFKHKVHGSGSFSVSDGPVVIDVQWDRWNANQKWSVDETTRERNTWSGRMETKGDKITSITLEKLAPKVISHMSYKKAKFSREQTVEEKVAAYDAEMLALGFTPAGTAAWDKKVASHVTTSNGGTRYTNGKKVITIKRAEQAGEVDMVTSVMFLGLGLPLSAIKGLKIA